MMNFLNRLVKQVIKVLHKLRAKFVIYRLSKTKVPPFLESAIKETFPKDVSPEEGQWIEKIESLRKALGASTTQLKIEYFTPARSGVPLTSEEVSRGRVITRTVGDVCEKTSKNAMWCLLLFKLIRKFKPASCIELGTSLGISASYQAAALKLNHQGNIVTLEGAGILASLAQEHFEELGLQNVKVVIGKFQDQLGGVLTAHQPVDYAFIDGHHDGDATLAYFEQIKPSLSDRAVVVFDDIYWNTGMKAAWKKITADPSVRISIDFWTLGVCVLDSSMTGKVVI